ncbi:hypothetical protein M8C21_004989, partial [Ambrosia artemisiifolia]
VRRLANARGNNDSGSAITSNQFAFTFSAYHAFTRLFELHSYVSFGVGLTIYKHWVDYVPPVRCIVPPP